MQWARGPPWRPPFAATREAVRYPLLRALSGLGGLGLFSRMQGKAVLTQETRRRIHGAIEADPGIRFNRLRRRMGVGAGTLTYHLSRLEAEGLVRRHRRGARLEFYPPGPPPAGPAGLEDRVAGYLRLHPGAGSAEIARALGTSRQAVHYHLRRRAPPGKP